METLFPELVDLEVDVGLGLGHVVHEVAEKLLEAALNAQILLEIARILYVALIVGVIRTLRAGLGQPLSQQILIRVFQIRPNKNKIFVKMSFFSRLFHYLRATSASERFSVQRILTILKS